MDFSGDGLAAVDIERQGTRSVSCAFGDAKALDGPSEPPPPRRNGLLRSFSGRSCALPRRAAGPGARSDERRLRDLEKLGLATREAPGRWRVSPNLLQKGATSRLPPVTVCRSARSPSRSKRKCVIRVRRGLTVSMRRRWLRFGFGAELRRFVQERQDALHRFGGAEGARDRADTLREVQRQVVGERFATCCGWPTGASMELPRFRGHSRKRDTRKRIDP
jgi:hypothetical protein